MLTVEEAYEAYRAGRLTYEEYRRQYANPADAERLERIRQQASKILRRR